MNTEHTPGPWKIGRSGPYGADVETEKGFMVAEVYRPEDASLIAAAPELLEAAEKAANLIDDHDSSGAPAAILRTAINKAKGES